MLGSAKNKTTWKENVCVCGCGCVCVRESERQRETERKREREREKESDILLENFRQRQTAFYVLMKIEMTKFFTARTDTVVSKNSNLSVLTRFTILIDPGELWRRRNSVVL